MTGDITYFFNDTLTLPLHNEDVEVSFCGQSDREYDIYPSDIQIDYAYAEIDLTESDYDLIRNQIREQICNGIVTYKDYEVDDGYDDYRANRKDESLW